jgi:L,D-transpeptidase catalytic domain
VASPVRRGAALLGAVVALTLPALAQAAPSANASTQRPAQAAPDPYALTPRPARPTSDPYALTPRLAHVARVVKSTRALAEPGAGRTVMRVSPLAEWGGGEVQFLVLRSALVGGRRWLEVRLPERPNSDAGWIRADLTRVSTTPWRIEVSTARARISVERAGKPVATFAAVVGKPSTPTPRGLFAVDEPIRQPGGSELGPWALFLTAHSRVLDDYGGGPGRIAIHGRAGPLLADPLGSKASHGCIRVANGHVRWLHGIAIPGTPVQITR